MNVISAIVVLLVASVGLAQAQPASTGSGQAYPSKPVRVVTPYEVTALIRAEQEVYARVVREAKISAN